MKKYILLLAIVMMALSLPVLAQAQDQAAALALLEDKATAGDALRLADLYNEGVIIPYVANDGLFSSGVAIFNASADYTNTFMISVYNTAGAEVASGTFSLASGACKVAMLQTLVGDDNLPAQGFAAVFAAGPFIVDRFIFQGGTAGFGELTMESQAY